MSRRVLRDAARTQICERGVTGLVIRIKVPRLISILCAPHLICADLSAESVVDCVNDL